MGVATDAPQDCKTSLNINIYPSTLVFFFLKILAISMILREIGWYLVGSGSISKEKISTEY